MPAIVGMGAELLITRFVLLCADAGLPPVLAA
jgi:hypothetical protein